MPTLFHPCGDRVLIRPDTEGGEKRTASGLIIIPDIGKTRPTTGTVIAIGPECNEAFEIGDKVLFGKYAGSDLKLNEEEVTIVRQEDILGVITEEVDESSIDESSSEPDPPTELAGSRGATDL
jgi:chaperonin GroES